MSLSDADAVLIGAVITSPVWGWLISRGRKAQRSGMEKLLATVTEDASEEYRAQAARMETQYKAEIERLQGQHTGEVDRLVKQYDGTIAFLQKELRGRGRGD